MSIKAFYRNWVGTVGKYSYRDASTGRTENVYTEFSFFKGNIQPWKEGMGNFSSDGVFIFRDFNLLYTKADVTFEAPDTIPSNATAVTLIDWWFYTEGKWYLVQGDENWTRAGRNPKHYKYYGQYISGQEDIMNDVGEPTPFPELVDQFENVVMELDQVSNYYS